MTSELREIISEDPELTQLLMCGIRSGEPVSIGDKMFQVVGGTKSMKTDEVDGRQIRRIIYQFDVEPVVYRRLA